MQFQVPQFIEVEDKIFGPLTFKQFIYVAGGLGLAYMIWRVAPAFIGYPLGILCAAFGTALAFLQWNSRPFIIGLENAFYYFIHSKLYLWNNSRRDRKQAEKKTATAAASQVYVPKLSESRLSELAWSLDIKERIAGGGASAEDREEHSPQSAIIAPIRTSERSA